MPAWENFFVAEVGASAALAGLVFVGVSINMTRILALPALPERAAQALTLLFSILIVSSVLLVPGQALWVVGVELVGIGMVIWYAAARVAFRSVHMVDPQYRRTVVLETGVVEFATLLYPAAGLVLFFWGTVGFYLLVPAFLASFIVAIIDSWVLLVEINR